MPGTPELLNVQMFRVFDVTEHETFENMFTVPTPAKYLVECQMSF